jgi:hypothetical protein
MNGSFIGYRRFGCAEMEKTLFAIGELYAKSVYWQRVRVKAGIVKRFTTSFNVLVVSMLMSASCGIGNTYALTLLHNHQPILGVSK